MLREIGHGFEAIKILQEARAVAGDPRFYGHAMDAIRKVCLKRDSPIQHAAILLKRVRGRDRMLTTIESQPELQRNQFRKRLVMDMDSAIAKLLDAAKPSLRRSVGVAAARDAQNWAGLSKEEKDEKWEGVFAMAMEEFDKRGIARGINNDDVFVPAPRLK